MAAMRTMTVEECSERLTKADIPFALAQSWEEILEDKQAWANECFYSMKYDNGNTRTLVRPPVNFAEMGEPDYARGPMIGEQGKDVLKEIGYTDEQINKLIDDKSLYIGK
jgi:cinnamoyl-CoA:phenyllactate CoA-transferase